MPPATHFCGRRLCPWCHCCRCGSGAATLEAQHAGRGSDPVAACSCTVQLCAAPAARQVRCRRRIGSISTRPARSRAGAAAAAAAGAAAAGAAAQRVVPCRTAGMDGTAASPKGHSALTSRHAARGSRRGSPAAGWAQTTAGRRGTAEVAAAAGGAAAPPSASTTIPVAAAALMAAAAVAAAATATLAHRRSWTSCWSATWETSWPAPTLEKQSALVHAEVRMCIRVLTCGQ